MGKIKKADEQTNCQCEIYTQSRELCLLLLFYPNKLVTKVLLFTDPSNLSFSRQPMQKTSALDTLVGG